jgi:hypothetical protein
MTNVIVSIGDTTIEGMFTAFVRETNGMLELEADPADIGEIRRRLGNEDAQDVNIVDPTRIGEMMY